MRMIRSTIILLLTAVQLFAAAPDFTKGDSIPKDQPKDWNLGATGARGWMYFDKLTTQDARQIYVTKVDKDTPADGVLAVGDVILGVGGKPFMEDPRTAFGEALTQAESNAGKGNFVVTRWRDGKQENVTLKLPVLGDYSATAPFECEKSKKVLEQGCEALAKKMEDENYPRSVNPISRSLNALALLASGNEKYLPLLKKEAKWAAGYEVDGFATWYYGYVCLFLAEYVIATGDEEVFPGLRRIAMEAVRGQSAVGTWGHKFAGPDGRLLGYGMMNSPGIPLTSGMVMAKAAGVDDPKLAEAIELSLKFLRFYIGKGAIPYGDHSPWIQNHEDNGKCGMTAVLFNIAKEEKGAKFFSKMSLASHGNERDTGHTGNYFNIAWAMPAVALSGPNATGEWMSEFGARYFDMARRPDGTFVHQGPPQAKKDAYGNWDATGLCLLAYAQPLKKIWLTGKLDPIVPQLSADEAKEIVVSGRGWNNKDRAKAYEQLNGDMLLEKLASWSPVIQIRAAETIAKNRQFPSQPIIAMLDSDSVYSRIGACEALQRMKGVHESAIPKLRENLKHDDMWVRVKAVEALCAIGEPAAEAVPDIIKLLTQTDPKNDPRAMEQRFISFALFNHRNSKMLDTAMDTLDEEELQEAIRAVLQNEDGRARGTIATVYGKLSYEQIKPLLPAIYKAVMEPAPSGIMFESQIRLAGLQLLAKNRIKEGMDAAVYYMRHQQAWASEKRLPQIIDILYTYGAHAQSVTDDMEKVAEYYDGGEFNYPKHLSKQKAQVVRDAIAKIKASTDKPDLRSMKE